MINNSKKFIIDVVPLTRLPLSRQQHFSYLYHKKIPIGSFVAIPLFKRSLGGIVIGNRSDFYRFGSIELKKVDKIIEKSFLTNTQLELAEFISNYYICPLGIVLKAFIPKIAKARNKKQEVDLKRKKEIELTKEQKVAVNSISKKRGKYYLYGPASSGKTEVYIESIRRLKKNEQALVLVPELTLTPQAIERYGSHFGQENVAVLTSKIPKGKFYKNWQDIKKGKARIIIGTRMAVLAPFRKIKLVILDEEQDMSFKQWDMNPRYDARNVSERICEIHKATIVRGSATPSIESYYKTMKNEYTLLKLPRLKNQLAPKIEIVDMRKERWKNNYSPVSKRLQEEVDYSLKNGQQIILFINRQGMSAFSICSDCKSVLKCPKCERALIYENAGNYHCPHCNYKSDILINCLKCKGISFRNIGVGTQKVEREINKLFPGAKTKRADAESMKKSGEREKLYGEFSSGKIDVLIGTQMITKGWDLPNIGLIGIIDVDSMLGFPDFRENEKAFQNVVQVAGRTNRHGSDFSGKVLLQTFDPENSIIQFMAGMDFEKLYSMEIRERKLLKYPPFGVVIRLIFRSRNEKNLNEKVEEVHKKLLEISEKEDNLRVTDPHDPIVPKMRGVSKKQIIIRTGSKHFSTRIKSLLKKLDGDWVIDVDPISIA